MVYEGIEIGSSSSLQKNTPFVLSKLSVVAALTGMWQR